MTLEEFFVKLEQKFKSSRVKATAKFGQQYTRRGKLGRQAGVISMGLALLCVALVLVGVTVGQIVNCTGEPNEPPIGRRFTLSLGLFLSGFFWSCRYRQESNNSRGLLSSSNIFGLSLSWLGLLIWWGTFAFPSTWGWWL